MTKELINLNKNIGFALAAFKQLMSKEGLNINTYNEAVKGLEDSHNDIITLLSASTTEANNDTK